MKKAADIAAQLFILSVVLLSGIAIFGIWEVFGKDVIWKAFESIGLLAMAAIIIIIADRFVDSHQTPVSSDGQITPAESTFKKDFQIIRHATLYLLIISVVLLALIGLLSIWEVLSGNVVTKSLASIVIVVFASFVIVVTCLDREDHRLLKKSKSASVGTIIIILLAAYWIFSLFRYFIY